MSEYVMVPKEPTEEMLDAGAFSYKNDGDWNDIFRAMLAAAPKPPILKAEEVKNVGFYWWCGQTDTATLWEPVMIYRCVAGALLAQTIGYEGSIPLKGQYIGPIKPEV